MAGKLRKWQQIIDLQSRHFIVPPNKGALWTGLGKFDERGNVEERGADRAARLARNRGLTTLEMTKPGQNLDNGVLKQKLDADFGSGWNDEKKAVWGLLSTGLAASLQGHVSVMIGQGSTKLQVFKDGAEELNKARQHHASRNDPIIEIPGFDGSGEPQFMLRQNIESVEGKILFDELMDLDISDPLRAEPGRVTSVSITEVNAQDKPISTYIMPLSKANN